MTRLRSGPIRKTRWSYGALLLSEGVEMSSKILSQSVSAYNQGLSHLAERMERAGAPSHTISKEIAHLRERRKLRRRGARKPESNFVLVKRFMTAILTDQNRN